MKGSLTTAYSYPEWPSIGIAAICSVVLQLIFAFSFHQQNMPKIVDPTQQSIEVELTMPTQQAAPTAPPSSSLPARKLEVASRNVPAPAVKKVAPAEIQRRSDEVPAENKQNQSEPVTSDAAAMIPDADEERASKQNSVPISQPDNNLAPQTPSHSPSISDIPAVTATPNYEHNPAPSYPPLARRRGWTGTVLLKVQVSASGTVLDVQLAKSSGHEVLDEAAQQAVVSWQFSPAMDNGVPVASWVEVPVRFELTS